MDLRWTKQLIDRANARSAGTRGGVERLPVCRYSVGGSSLRWDRRRGLLFACAIASLTATASVAQDANYTSVEATPDKPVELSYHASAHKSNCSAGALPTLRVLVAPTSGTLTVRKAVLTTSKISRMPGPEDTCTSGVLRGPHRLRGTGSRQVRGDDREWRSRHL